MNPTCIQAVARILGKLPSEAIIKRIEDDTALQMRLLAKKDPAAWRALSLADRVSQAAQAAAEGMVAEAQKKQQRLGLAIAAADKVNNFLNGKELRKPGDKLRAVSQLLDFDTKGGGFTSVGSYTKALQNQVFGELMATLGSSHPKFFGLFENREGTRDLVRELWGEHTGNAAAAAGAAKWREAMDELRDRFNAAGGDVGKLDEWHYPQSHSQQRVAAAGFDQWFADTLPLLDRSKYIRPDGRAMNEGELRALFGRVFDTITTDGQNKLADGVPRGYGLAANRGNEHRVVFYKDAESYLSYQGNYGDKSLWNTLTGHVRGIARDIALAETLGPQSERLFQSVNQRALLEELRANPTRSSSLRAQSLYNERLFDYVSGRQAVVDPALAARFQGFRNFLTAVKLPKVVITALGDEAGMMASAFANKIPYSEVFSRELATLNPMHARDRRVLQSNGLGLESFLQELNRFGQDAYNSSWTSKLAGGVLRMSGAERMWDARRQGLGSIIMSYLADTVGKVDHFADIDRADHGVLANKGITEADWQTWRQADPELWSGGKPMLTPKSVMAIPDERLQHLGDPVALRRHAATNLLAHVLEEAGMGAMDTGARQRVAMQMGTNPGTWAGELMRSALLFKSFAASMMMKHWYRAGEMPGLGSKFAYMAPLLVYGAIIAALGNQVRNVIAGRDPANMADPRFWGAAILRGGGLGFFGDFFYDEFTEHDTSLAAALGGPMMTTAEELWKLTGAAAIKALRGERTDEGANLVRFAKENTPFLNLWYTQAAMDHILWNHIQEAANPGYLERMQARAEATKGTTYYWQPQEALPARAPDVSVAHLFDTEAASESLHRYATNVGIE